MLSGVHHAHRSCSSPKRRRSGPVLPDESASTAHASNQGVGCGAGEDPPPHVRRVQPHGPLHSGGFSPSALSSSSDPKVCARHHPSAHEERDATALPRLRPACTGFYSGHTPPLRELNHPGVSARAPGTNPGPRRGSRVSGGLRSTDHVGSRCDPAVLSSHVRGSRPGVVTVLLIEHAFEREKPEAPLYPSTTGFSNSASSSVELTGKPLTP
jgi:hypothetical protein